MRLLPLLPSRRRPKSAAFAAVVAALGAGLCAVAWAQTEVYIGVEGARSNSPRWVIGLPPFQAEHKSQPEETRLAYEIREVVRYDLSFSGYFKPVAAPSGAAAADPRKAAQDWKRTGAGFILNADVSNASAKTTITISLLDLASEEAVLERYYRQDTRSWRSAAHQLADDVTKQLTGKPGIAHTKIAFINDKTGSKELYAMDYDGEGLRQLTNDRSIALLPRWSPDRKKILYTSYKAGNPDLFEINFERGTTRVFSNRQGLNLAGGFSPDGAQAVLTLSMQKNPNIYLASLAGSSVKPLTQHFGVDASPTFSPDGGQVAFVSDRSGNPQVHILDLGTGRTRRLTHLNWCDTPAWSPTGEWIVFSGRANSKDRMDLFLVDVTGNQVRQLTHGEGSNEDPAWSADGRFLLFTSTRPGRRQLFVMAADGSAPRPIADIPGNSFTPAWSL